MTEAAARQIREQPRFRGIFQDYRKIDNEHNFHKKIALTSSMTHSDEGKYIEKSLETGFSGENVRKLEKEIAVYTGVGYAAALNSGTAAVHMAIVLAAEKVYGSFEQCSTLGRRGQGRILSGKRVFCSDFTSPEMIDPILYEGGEPVFLDVSEEDWGMDPEVLEMAFQRYPDVKIVIMNHAYGFPGQVREIKGICERHGALLIEDASESFGAKASGRLTGSIGDYGILDFSQSKIITGFGGGMLLLDNRCTYETVKSRAGYFDRIGSSRKCEEVSYNYTMSDTIAGMVLGQLQYIDRYIARKKAIYEKYLEKFDDDLISMNPVGKGTEPNYWISCMVCDSNIQFDETRSERDYTYTDQHGTASPMEIYDALEAFQIRSMPVYKPASLQPAFQGFDQITLDGSRRSYRREGNSILLVRRDVSRECFSGGLCLPSDIQMTEEDQKQVIDVVHACFSKANLDRGMWEFF